MKTLSHLQKLEQFITYKNILQEMFKDVIQGKRKWNQVEITIYQKEWQAVPST